MQTERVTFLTTPTGKANLTSRAAARGISVGEYVRRKVEEEDELTPEQEAELAALVVQVNEAIPAMQKSLDHSIQMLSDTRRFIDQTLREAGLRE